MEWQNILIMSGMILLMLICCIVKRRKRNAPVVVTSVTHEQPGYIGPPPSQQQYQEQYQYRLQAGQQYPMPQPAGYQPMPQPGAYPPYQPQAAPNAPYSTAPYPTMPYPPSSGLVVGGPPTNMDPPSYDQVLTAEQYQKQAAYNPNYAGR